MCFLRPMDVFANARIGTILANKKCLAQEANRHGPPPQNNAGNKKVAFGGFRRFKHLFAVKNGGLQESLLYSLLTKIN